MRKRDWREQLKVGVNPEEIDYNEEHIEPRRVRKEKKRGNDEGVRRHHHGLPPTEEA